MSADRELNPDVSDDNNLCVQVRPKVEFRNLLQHAGATKDVFTMKEVMFYLGQYIIQKRLYDEKQQHIVHCSQDALGRVLGVDSFSVKEPRALFAMIIENLVAVRIQDSPPSLCEAHSNSQTDGGTEEADSQSRSSSPERRRRRRSGRSSEPGPSHGVEDDEDEESEEGDGRNRRRSSDPQSPSGRSEVAASASDSDSDNFSVEFEVESIASDDYNEDDASLSADDQVYEVTMFEAEDEDSFDEDTEITEADYWRCANCDELNPVLPRNCLRCWTLRHDWLPEDGTNSASLCPNALPLMPTDQSAATEGSDVEENEGVDVPDGKRANVLSQCLSDSTLSVPDSTSSVPNSQDLLSSSQLFSSFDFQLPCSSIASQELLPPSPIDPPPPLPPPPVIPELERSVSERSVAEWRLPESCLDPCIICQSRPKSGCIVHGRTGHLISCYVCARKLKKRNKPCPVCRLPIQSVILTYLS